MSYKKEADDAQVMDKESVNLGDIANSQDTLHIDPVVERRVIRKLDQHIMPFICTSYFLTYLDKGHAWIRSSF